MSTSLIYRSSRGYELLMRALYGRHYEDRMRVVAAQVPAGASVLELCCGPGTLYFRYLKDHPYIGLDVNEGFVERLKNRGVDARRVDLATSNEPLPTTDVALIQASLYHFLPAAERILDRMLEAAQQRVIVSEPIRNLSCSRAPVIGSLGQRATDPGTGGHEHRFNEATLDALMERYAPRVIRASPAPGGREKVYVLDARGSGPAPTASTG